MSKRYTETNKWEDSFFHALDDKGKLAWLFLLDKCDHAGIWKVNFKLMEFFIGCQARVSWFDGRVIELSPEKWFIPKFIKFQYGELSRSCRAHKTVIEKLEKEGISIPLAYPIDTLSIPYRYPIGDSQYINNNNINNNNNLSINNNLNINNKSKEIGDVGEREQKNFVKPTAEDVSTYAKSIQFILDGESFIDYYDSKGWLIGKTPMKNWKAAVRTWKRRHANDSITTGSASKNVGYATAVNGKYPD